MAMMSQSEFARHKGVTPGAVTRMVKRGRIKLHDGKVNTEEAERELAIGSQKVDPNKNPNKKRTGRPPDPLAPIPGINGPADQQPVTFAQATTMKEAYRAKLAKLEYETKMGTLIPVAQVKKEAFEAARQVREAFMVLPERVSAILANQDEPLVRERLKAEVVLILKTIAGEL